MRRGVRPPRNRLPEATAAAGRRRKRPRVTAGDTWKPNAVRYILKNPIYAGIMEYGRTPQGKLNQLIDGEFVETRQAGEMLAEGGGKPVAMSIRSGGYVSLETLQESVRLFALRKKTRSPRDNYPLSSGKVIFCGRCGYSMYGKPVRAGGRRYTYYICSQTRRPDNACKSYSVREKSLITHIASKVLEDYLGEAHLRRLEKKLAQKVGRQYETKPREAEAARAEAARLAGQLRNLLETLKSRELCDEVRAELVREMNEVSRQKREAETRLRDAEKAASVPRAEMDVRVRAALEKLRSLRGRLAEVIAGEYDDGARSLLDRVLRLIVVRVDLFFRDVPQGKRNHCELEHGTITCRPRISFGDDTAAAPKRVILFDGSELQADEFSAKRSLNLQENMKTS
jgi:hypothetical protein